MPHLSGGEGPMAAGAGYRRVAGWLGGWVVLRWFSGVFGFGFDQTDTDDICIWGGRDVYWVFFW